MAKLDFELKSPWFQSPFFHTEICSLILHVFFLSPNHNKICCLWDLGWIGEAQYFNPFWDSNSVITLSGFCKFY